jgi:hypothetical protein
MHEGEFIKVGALLDFGLGLGRDKADGFWPKQKSIGVKRAG